MATEMEFLESIRMSSKAASVAHDGQFRKYTSPPVPYIVHPARVAFLIPYYEPDTYNQTAIIAAWMHDMIEDCGEKGIDLFEDALSRMPLHQVYKKEVSDIVIALTKDDNIHPRAAKWQDAIDKVLDESAPNSALLVKICDRIDNLTDLKGFKEGFVKLYLDETDHFIDEIRRVGRTWEFRQAFDGLERLSRSMR